MVFSTHHPTMDWPEHSPEDYFAIRQITETWETESGEFDVTFWRRPLTAMTEAIAAAGFVIERLTEPEPAARLAELDPRADRLIRTQPRFLFFRLRPAPAGAVTGPVTGSVAGPEAGSVADDAADPYLDGTYRWWQLSRLVARAGRGAGGRVDRAARRGGRPGLRAGLGAALPGRRGLDGAGRRPVRGRAARRGGHALRRRA